MSEELHDEPRWGRCLEDFNAPHDHDPIIAARAVEPFVLYAQQRGLDEAALWRGAARPAGSTEPISWAQFIIFCHRFTDLLDSEPETLLQAARQVTRSPGYAFATAFAGMLAEPHYIYRIGAHWFFPQTFPCMSSEQLQPLTQGRLRHDIALRQGWSPSPIFFRFNAAMIATSTCMLGLTESLVATTDMTPRSCSYIISPPLSGTLLGRARRGLDMVLKGGNQIVSELEEQHRELLAVNARLQSKVAELELTQAELHATRARYARAIDGTREGIWELELDTQHLHVSPRWREIMGSEPTRSKESWLAAVAPSDRTALSRALRAEHDSLDLTFRLDRPATDAKWVRVRASLMRDERGMASYLAGSITDITHEERSRRDLMLLLQESPQPLALATPVGELLYANRAFCELLVAPSGEELPALARVQDFMETNAWDALLEALDAHGSAASEQRWHAGREEWRDVYTKLRPITLPSGGAILMSVEDLAARRAEQANMIHMDRIISMGTMAASIGHEINNPMAFIQSNIEFARERIRALSEITSAPSTKLERITSALPELSAALDEAHQGATRVVRIVRDLRSFARFREADSLTEAPLNAFVHPALNMVRAELQQHASLNVHIEHDARLALKLDASRLTQILTNLLLNAAQAVAVAPHSTLQHRVTLRASSPSPQRVCFAVHDTGSGISPQHIERIFDPFFTRQRAGQGTGLGLYICKILVDAMGGTIWVESQPEQGASFFVELPTSTRILPTEDLDTSEILMAPTSPDAPPHTLLIVDDELALLDVFARRFEREFEVTTSEDGALALALIHQGLTPSLILCDVLMPQMNGVQLFDALQAQHPELCARVVFMTGGCPATLSEQVTERGAQLLTKPLQHSALMAAFRQIHTLPPPL